MCYKDKPNPSSSLSNSHSVVQTSSASQQKAIPVEHEPPRADGSDKYYGMENVCPFLLDISNFLVWQYLVYTIRPTLRQVMLILYAAIAIPLFKHYSTLNHFETL
jgi:hypothetical protein